MSAIPPNVIGSVLQAGVAQQVQATQKDAAENAQTDAARRTAGFNDILEIEATDADGRVHADSGGLGSQGRHDAPPEEQPAPEKPNAVTHDENGRPHLDLSA